MYEFIQIRIHIMYEFIYFLYEFIYYLQCKIKAASAHEPRVRAASAQLEPRGRSPSSPPAPTRLHPAAPTVRVVFDCPDQLGCVRLPQPVRVRSAAPII